MAAVAARLDFRLERVLLLFIYNSDRYFLSSYESFGLLVQKFKIDFHVGRHGVRLGFLVGLMLTIFYLQVTSIIPIEFRVN